MKHLLPTFKLALFATTLLISSSINAQDQYDFAEVFIDAQAKIHIIQNKKSDKIIDPEKRSTDSYGLSERFLNQLSKMTADGWEVITITQGGMAYLKRKVTPVVTEPAPTSTEK